MALAEGGHEPGRRIARIDALLRKLQDALAQDDSSSDLYRSRNALAFGLHEVRRTLVGLIEVQPNRGPN